MSESGSTLSSASGSDVMDVSALRDPARLTFELAVDPHEVGPLLDVYQPLLNWIDSDLRLFRAAEAERGLEQRPCSLLNVLGNDHVYPDNDCCCVSLDFHSSNPATTCLNGRRHSRHVTGVAGITGGVTGVCGVPGVDKCGVGCQSHHANNKNGALKGILVKNKHNTDLQCDTQQCDSSSAKDLSRRGSRSLSPFVNNSETQTTRHRNSSTTDSVTSPRRAVSPFVLSEKQNELIQSVKTPKHSCCPFSVLLFLFEEEISTGGRVDSVRRRLDKAPWRLHHTESPPRRNLNLNSLALDYFFISDDLPLWGVRQVHYGKEHIRVVVQTRKDTFEDMVAFYTLILGLQPDLQREDFCLFTVHSQIHFDIQFALKRGEELSPVSSSPDPCPLPPRDLVHSARLRFKVGDLGRLVPLFPNVCQPVSDTCWLTTDHDGNEVILDVSNSMTSSSSSSSSTSSDRGVGSMESSCASASSSDVSFDSHDSGHSLGSGGSGCSWDSPLVRPDMVVRVTDKGGGGERRGVERVGAIERPGPHSTLSRFTRTKCSQNGTSTTTTTTVNIDNIDIVSTAFNSNTNNVADTVIDNNANCIVNSNSSSVNNSVVLRKNNKSSMRKDSGCCSNSSSSSSVSDVRKSQRRVTFCFDDVPPTQSTSHRSDSPSNPPGQNSGQTKVKPPVPQRTSSLSSTASSSSSTSSPRSLDPSAADTLFTLRFDTCPTAPLSRNNTREEQIGFFV